MGKPAPHKKMVKEPGQVKCPHLLSRAEKICLSMVESGLDSEVSSFDVKHFCDDNPIHCYYHRFAPSNDGCAYEVS